MAPPTARRQEQSLASDGVEIEADATLQRALVERVGQRDVLRNDADRLEHGNIMRCLRRPGSAEY